jgi:hypothetical protein
MGAMAVWWQGNQASQHLNTMMNSISSHPDDDGDFLATEFSEQQRSALRMFLLVMMGNAPAIVP